MRIPTISELKEQYLQAAVVERLKCGRPSELTVRNTMGGLRRFLDWLTNDERLGEEACNSLANINAKTLRKYLASMVTSGIKPISAYTFVMQLRQLFARWALVYYEDLDWEIPVFPTFPCHTVAPRYRRPPAALIARVKEWYQGLKPSMLWYVATMMLEFGVRNGDVRRLTRENFIESGERCYLNYTPHKTSLSSGRMVRWPIHPEIWRVLEQLTPWSRRVTETHFTKLNVALRELGFKGTKGAYELRKICIDHIYQKFGAEMAVSISGDDIKTISRYYADPAQPNLGDIRVTELL